MKERYYIRLILFDKVEKILKGSLDSILQQKFKLWAETFSWVVKAKHCWSLATNFWKQNFCWHHPAMFCLITLNNFHWRWRWWDPIQATFLNIFYFNGTKLKILSKITPPLPKSAVLLMILLWHPTDKMPRYRLIIMRSF